MEKQEVFELDLIDLFYYIRKRIVMVLMAGLLLGGGVFLINRFVITPVYTASTRVYVLSRTDSSISYSDFQSSAKLAEDYEVLITGINITEEVVKELDLPMSAAKLSSMISVTNLSDSRILQIDVKDTDPQRAADIANLVCRLAQEQIETIMEIDAVNLIYAARVPTSPSGPAVGRNTALAVVTGMLLMIIILVVLYMVDDSIKTEEDVERYLQMSTVGVIPLTDKMMFAQDHSAQSKYRHGTVKQTTKPTAKQTKRG